MNPKNWIEYRLKDLVDIDSSTLSSRTPPDYMFEYVSLSDVQNGEILKTERYIYSEAPSRAKRKIKKNDILLATVRPNLKNFTVIRNDVQDYIASTGFAVLTPKNSSDVEYIYQYLYSFHITKQISRLVSGSNYPAINSSDVKNLRILAPKSSHEREKIGEIAKNWDISIKYLKELINLKRKRKKSLLQFIFVKKFNDDSCVWNEHEFKSVVSKYIDFRGRTPLKLGMEWGNGEIKALSANNIKKGYIDFDRECYLGSEELYVKWMTKGDCEKDDILMTMEAPLGNIAQVPDNQKYILSQRALLIRPKSKIVRKTFLRYLMETDKFQNELTRNASGSTAQGIQRKRLDTIKIEIPDLKNQEKVEKSLILIDQEINSLELLKTKYEIQKCGLMQELLTGKTSLKFS